MDLRFEIDSAEAMQSLGEYLGGLLRGGEVFSLSGPLGVGKTTFVQGVARALDVREMVTSPSFAIIHVHDGRLRLIHCDFYRLESSDELENIGFDDYLGAGNVVFAEWGSPFLTDIPGGVSELSFHDHGSARTLSVCAAARDELLVREWVAKWQSLH